MKKNVVLMLVIGVSLVTVGIVGHMGVKGKVAGVSDSAEMTKVYQGLVVPHHELASPLIDRAVAVVADSGASYSNVVIISPNHEGANDPFVTTATKLTGFNVNSEVVKSLGEFDFVQMNEELLNKEHGILVPAAYVFGAFPNSQLVPLAISPNNTLEQMEELVNWLVTNIPGNTLFVLSSDFSHNQMMEQAFSNHELMKTVLANFDYETLSKLDDTYLDTPVGAEVFLRTMERLRATDWQMIEESHGALLLEKPNLKGTSYMTGVFAKSMVE